MKKLIPILTMILFLIPIIYAGSLTSTDIIYYALEEDFDTLELYTKTYMTSRDTPSIKNWTLSTSGTGCDSALNLYPINSSIYNSYSFGTNYTTSCGTNYNLILAGDLPVNISDSKIIIKYNLSILSHSESNAAFQLTFKPGIDGGAGAITFIHGINDSSVKPYYAKITPSNKVCNMSLSKDVPQSHEYTIIIDQNLNVFSWYADGYNDGNCENIDIEGHDLDTSNLGNIAASIFVKQLAFTEIYFDDIVIGTGTVSTEVGSSQSCIFPMIFCDNFNYNTNMQGNGWLIYNWGYTLNNSFAPIDNKMSMIDNTLLTAFHETPIFETTYYPDSEGRYLQHYLAPVFSSEFDLVFYNSTDNEFKYTALEKQGVVAWSIKADLSDNGGDLGGNMDWYFRNTTSITWNVLCENCTYSDTTTPIKINSYFAQRDEFPFNSTVSQDLIEVYAAGNLLGSFNNFIDNTRVKSIRQYEFAKRNEGNYTIDNYFVMVGTDKLTYTADIYYEDLFNNLTDKEIVVKEGTGELIDAVNSIWEDFGLKTTGSRVFAGISLMFLLAIFIYGAGLSTNMHVSPITLGIIELFFMIVLVYIKLLPIWIPFILVLITAGIGAVVFKMGSG